MQNYEKQPRNKISSTMDLHMSIGLNNMISMQKALKTYFK